MFLSTYDRRTAPNWLGIYKCWFCRNKQHSFTQLNTTICYYPCIERSVQGAKNARLVVMWFKKRFLYERLFPANVKKGSSGMNHNNNKQRGFSIPDLHRREAVIWGLKWLGGKCYANAAWLPEPVATLALGMGVFPVVLGLPFSDE